MSIDHAPEPGGLPYVLWHRIKMRGCIGEGAAEEVELPEGVSAAPGEGLYCARGRFRTLREIDTPWAGGLCRCYHTQRETAPRTVLILRPADRHPGEVRPARRHREARRRGLVP